MNNILKYLVFALLGLLIGLYFYNKYRVAPAVDFNKLELFDTEGNPVSLKDMKGKKMIVSFGASWCGNCVEELKMISEIKDTKLADVDVIVISDEDMEKVRAFRNKKGYPFTFLKMNGSFHSIGVNAVPTTYIINTEFEVKDETVGYIGWNEPSTVEHIKKLME